MKKILISLGFLKEIHKEVEAKGQDTAEVTIEYRGVTLSFTKLNNPKQKTYIWTFIPGPYMEIVISDQSFFEVLTLATRDN